MLPSATYTDFVQKSSKLYRNLAQAMVSEMLRSIMYENKKPEGASYYQLPEWQAMWHALSAFNPSWTGPSAPLTQTQLDQIRTRDWIPLLDSLFGTRSWKAAPSANFNYANH